MNRTCLKCGRVAFGVTREYAVNAVADFNAYYDQLSREDQQANYGGIGARIVDYELCRGCGGPHTNFRDALPGDCPDGVTLNPIIIDTPAKAP